MATLLPWILGAAGLAASAFFFVRLRAVEQRLAGSRLASEKLEKELHGTRGQLEKRAANQRRQRDDLQQIQKKFDKLKKRAARSNEDRGIESDRVKELERLLRLRSSELEAARAGRSEESPATPVVKVELPRPPSPPPAAPVDTSPLLERAEAAERRLREREAELAAAQHDVLRLRERVRTQDKLYVAIHGEIEVKKDRIRQLTEDVERLRAFKVAVVDPLPDSANRSSGEELGPTAGTGAIESVAPEPPHESLGSGS